jgi:hypothetical protein
MKLIFKSINTITRLLKFQPHDQRVEILRKRLVSGMKSLYFTQNNNKALIAVQGVEDPLFFGLFAALSLELKVATGCRANLIQIRSINGAVGTCWRAMVRRSWFVCALINRQWANANKDLIGPVAFRSNSISHLSSDLIDWIRAHNLWRSLKEQTNISNLTVDSVVVGDLLIDSYLRYRPSPQFNVRDPFVRKVLWQCLRDLRRSKCWFGSAKPALYLSSYSTYIEHGIAVRVALSYGIPVYVYGNLTTFGRALSCSNYYHTTDTGKYREIFKGLIDQDEKLAEAEEQLKLRLTGVIDTATAYMKVSAYAHTDVTVPEVRGSVVVFMHDFYDSPHIYPGLIFPDFWAWIDCTICTLREAGIPFWIKPHPNEVELSSKAYKALLTKHPDIRILDQDITNTQLVQAGIICGITVYGTVAHELAYLGVSSIACAQHPHHAYEFCTTASSVEEYVGMLRNQYQCPLTQAEMKRQALEFYYMHNLHGDDDMLEVRRQFVKLWKSSDTQTDQPEDLYLQLDKLRNLPGWRAHINLLTKNLIKHDN